VCALEFGKLFDSEVMNGSEFVSKIDATTIFGGRHPSDPGWYRG